MVLDRVTGEFLLGKPYVEVNWMDGFDAKGRPHRVPGVVPSPQRHAGATACARRHQLGATGVQPAHRPVLCGALGALRHRRHPRASSRSPWASTRARPPWATRTLEPFLNNDDEARGVIRAYDPATLKPRWEYASGQHHLGWHAVDGG